MTEDRIEGDWKVTRRVVSSPIRFAGFNLGDYEKASQTRAGLTIEVYANRRIETALQPRPREYLPPPTPAPPRPGARRPPADLLSLPSAPITPDPKARLRSLADEIGAAMEFMSANFGPPPLKTLTVSPIPGSSGRASRA